MSTNFKASPQQQAVFDWVSSESGNAIVQAVAGSGKTTTILQAMRLLPKTDKLLYLVYNKDMQTEITARPNLPTNLECYTTHSYGFKAVKECSNVGRIRVNQYKTHDYVKAILGKSVKYGDYRIRSYAVADAVGWAKNQGLRASDLDATRMGEIAVEQGAESSSLSTAQLADLGVLAYDALCDAEDNLSTIDFDDMLWLPTTNDSVSFPCYDWVFVDETQDLNPCQIAMLAKMQVACPKTRFLFVGDRSQSIFSFRGADPTSMDKLQATFNAKPLALSVSYRCDKRVVAEAAKYVADEFLPGPAAEEGLVTTTTTEAFRKEVKRGDMILCRCNAPLVRECLAFIRQGLNAKVLGRDIGRNLLGLYKNLVEKHHQGDVYEAIHEAESVAQKKLCRPGDESKSALLADKFTALMVLFDSPTDGYDQLKAKIDKVFTDDESAYVFSTVHKAKGKEADNVWLLRPDLLPFPKSTDFQSERNLQYVAVSRARRRFHYVRDNGEA